MMLRACVYIFLIFAPCLAIAQFNLAEENLAKQYYQNNDFEKAAVLYRKLFNNSKNQNYYEEYFNCLLQLKQFDEAENFTRQQLKKAPFNNTYSINIGLIYQERGQSEKAAAWFNNLIKNLPKNEFAIRGLSTLFYRIEGYDYAIKTLINGRKVLNEPNAFTYELISLYRYRKDKVMLVQELLNLLTVTPEVLLQAENSISSVFEENADYELLQTALLKRIQKDPQNIALTELLIWQYIQKKEFSLAFRQTVALDRRLKEDGDRVYLLSRLLLENKAFDEAISSLNHLVSKGPDNPYYIVAKTDLINTKFILLTAKQYKKPDLLELEKNYLALLDEFGKKISTAYAMRQLANLQAFHLNKSTEAEVLLEELLQIPGLKKSIIGETKLELGDIYILSGEVWEAALIYGQVEKQFANTPIGQEAQFRNAKLSYYQGDFTWAKAQLDVLKGSTSQLIANDALNLSLLISDNLQSETDTIVLKKFAYADMLMFKNLPDKALNTLDSIDANYKSHSLADDILMYKAKIFLSKKEFATTISLLQKIAENHSFDLWGDDAVYMLAEIFETKLNDPEKAKQLYQKIITDYPGSLFVIEARKRFRNLRGDKV